MRRRAFVSSAFATAIGGASARGATSDAVVPALSFHNDFWVNLHHRLYRQAAAALAVSSGESLRAMAPRLYAERAWVSADDRAGWNAAIDAYERHYAARDLLFDRALSSYAETLSGLPNAATASLARHRLPPTLTSALRTAAPIYARAFWTHDRASNASWIDAAIPRVRQFGDRYAKRLAALYRTPWRDVPYRDDIVRYANWAEAYTEDERSCVYGVIGSASPGNGGRASLEAIFHEASHSLVFPDDGTVATEIDRAATKARRDPPDQLWHAIIFYTAGHVARESYASAGARDYVPFAEAAGLWAGPWSRYRAALDAHWRPYVTGHGTFGTAIERALRDSYA